MPKVTFFEDRCKGCMLCTTVCPKKLISINEESFNAKGFHPARITNMERCIGCGSCFIICPDCAIKVEG